MAIGRSISCIDVKAGVYGKIVSSRTLNKLLQSEGGVYRKFIAGLNLFWDRNWLIRSFLGVWSMTKFAGTPKVKG